MKKAIFSGILSVLLVLALFELLMVPATSMVSKIYSNPMADAYLELVDEMPRPIAFTKSDEAINFDTNALYETICEVEKVLKSAEQKQIDAYSARPQLVSPTEIIPKRFANFYSDLSTSKEEVMEFNVTGDYFNWEFNQCFLDKNDVYYAITGVNAVVVKAVVLVIAVLAVLSATLWFGNNMNNMIDSQKN